MINTERAGHGDGLGTSVITASLAGVSSPGDVLTVVAPSFVVEHQPADDLNYTGRQDQPSRSDPGRQRLSRPYAITFDPNVFATAKTITLTLGLLELTDTTGTETITGPAAGVTVSARRGQRRVPGRPGCQGVDLGSDDHRRWQGRRDGGGLIQLRHGHSDQLHRQRQLRRSRRRPCATHGSLALTNCTVSGNSASGDRRRRGHFYGTATLTSCTVSGNSAGLGGGVYNFSGTPH